MPITALCAAVIIAATANAQNTQGLRPIVNTDYDGCGSSCSECEGDCDYDSDCAGTLECGKRYNENDVVPGCEGDYENNYGDRWSSEEYWDYCYDPNNRPSTANVQNAQGLWPVVNTDRGGCGSSGCSECEGDCDSDSDCAGTLECAQRDDEKDVVPGCETTGYENNSPWTCCGGAEPWDYCYDPNDRGPMISCSSVYPMDNPDGCPCDEDYSGLFSGLFGSSLSDCAGGCCAPVPTATEGSSGIGVCSSEIVLFPGEGQCQDTGALWGFIVGMLVLAGALIMGGVILWGTMQAKPRVVLVHGAYQDGKIVGGAGQTSF